LETGSAHKLPPIVEPESQKEEQRTVVIDIQEPDFEENFPVHETLIIRKPRKFKKLVTTLVLLGALAIGWVFYSGTQTKVPQLVGLTQTQAMESISNAELSLEIKEVFSEVVPLGVVISADPASGNGVSKNTVVTIVISKGPEYFTVPNLQNMTVKEAESALIDAGLKLGTTTFAFSDDIKKNHVVSADPAIGELAKPNSLVSVVISKGKAPVAIPSVVGSDEASATAQLNGLGFSNLTIVKEYSNTVATGVVISQTPEVGLEVLTKTQITLVVSKGVKPVSVPNIIGMTKANAITALENSKLTYKIIGQATCNTGFKKNTRKISQQSVSAGNKVPPGTEIGFYVDGKCKNP
jgi:serine/threonine-protein kinase